MFRKEFATFCGLIEKTQKKLQEATNTIEDAHKKTTTIQRKLNKVTTLEVESGENDILDFIDYTDTTDSETTEEE